MIEPKAPKRWANDLTILLNALGGKDRFPVKLKELAYDYSKQVFPDDPITLIKGDSLPGFEGGLFRARDGKQGWGIIYNTDAWDTRINFTLAHEFGHYLIHRTEYPNGIRCKTDDIERWDSEYRQVEQQANEFAATLLMPFDDFRAQIGLGEKPDFDEIGACADRYGVSLIAATLRWLQYTSRRAILVKSIDGFIHWARSSEAAFKTHTYIKTSGRPPIEIPEMSLPNRTDLLEGNKGTTEHGANAWLNEPCIEHTMVSERFDFALSLLHLGEARSWSEPDEEMEEDTYDRMTRKVPRSF